jgi:hypothetical protein
VRGQPPCIAKACRLLIPWLLWLDKRDAQACIETLIGAGRPDDASSDDDNVLLRVHGMVYLVF